MNSPSLPVHAGARRYQSASSTTSKAYCPDSSVTPNLQHTRLHYKPRKFPCLTMIYRFRFGRFDGMLCRADTSEGTSDIPANWPIGPGREGRIEAPQDSAAPAIARPSVGGACSAIAGARRGSRRWGQTPTAGAGARLAQFAQATDTCSTIVTPHTTHASPLSQCLSARILVPSARAPASGGIRRRRPRPRLVRQDGARRRGRVHARPDLPRIVQNSPDSSAARSRTE